MIQGSFNIVEKILFKKKSCSFKIIVEAPLTRLLCVPLKVNSPEPLVLRIDAPDTWLASILRIPSAQLRFDRVFGMAGFSSFQIN